MQIIRPVPITDTGGFTRASTATNIDNTGKLIVVGVDVPRFNYNIDNLLSGPSFLLESSASNILLKDISTIPVGTVDPTPYQSAQAGSTIVSQDVISVYADRVLKHTNIGNTNVCFQSVTFPASSTLVASMYIYIPTAYTGAITLTLEGNVGPNTAIIPVDILKKDKWTRIATKATANVGQTSTSVVLRLTNSSSPVYSTAWNAVVGTSLSSFIVPLLSTPSIRAAETSGMMVSNVPETDYPAYNPATRYIAGDRVMDLPTHTVYEGALGARGTGRFNSVDTGHVIITSNGQLYKPAIDTQVVFTTTGSLPNGITAGTTYFVLRYLCDGFSLSTGPQGAEINITGNNSGIHTATVSSNINVPVTDTRYWLNAGSNNRWRMFDQSITSQTSQVGGINVAILPGARFDRVVGLNVAASDVTINIDDPIAGNVYSKRLLTTLDSGITDWYGYFYEPIVQATEFVVDDILATYVNAIITVSINSTGVAAIGGLIVGLSKEIGITEWGAKVGIVDYSVKTRDTFGNYNVTKRNFSKRADFTVQVPTKEADNINNILTTYRATPVVYVGSNTKADQQFSSTIIYGYYKDYSIDINYPLFSVCTIQVEGLT